MKQHCTDFAHTCWTIVRFVYNQRAFVITLLAHVSGLQKLPHVLFFFCTCFILLLYFCNTRRQVDMYIPIDMQCVIAFSDPCLSWPYQDLYVLFLLFVSILFCLWVQVPVLGLVQQCHCPCERKMINRVIHSKVYVAWSLSYFLWLFHRATVQEILSAHQQV